jgi:photosystem II stability/assembly factor-like uncharacterized protein
MSSGNSFQTSTVLMTVPLLIIASMVACSSTSSGAYRKASQDSGKTLARTGESASPSEFGYPQLLDSSCWIVSEGTRLLKTVDSGKTWTVIYSIETPTESENQIRGVKFVDAKLGFLIIAGRLFGGRLLRTTNGGDKWENMGEIYPPESRVSFENCYFIDAQQGWAVGLVWSKGFGGNDPSIPAYEGAVFATTDGGRTWQQQPISPPKGGIDGLRWAVNDVVFRDKNRGWIVCDAGMIFSTDDGGATWRPMVAKGVDYQRVTFLDDQFGWASYKYGNGPWGVAVTSDGGHRWRGLSESLVLGSWPVHAVFLNPTHGFAISLALYETQDQGRTWTKRSGGESSSDASYNYLGRTPDGTLVLLGTQDNKLLSLVSTDEGATWRPTQ